MFVLPKAKKGDDKVARRTKGDGTLRKRTDGRWEGWFNIGKDENGNKVFI